MSEVSGPRVRVEAYFLLRRWAFCNVNEFLFFTRDFYICVLVRVFVWSKIVLRSRDQAADDDACSSPVARPLCVGAKTNALFLV